MEDRLNPEFMFQTLDTELLVNVMKSGNVEELLRKELANRGVDQNGKWCGFDRAEKIWTK